MTKASDLLGGVLRRWYEASLLVLHVEDELLRAARVAIDQQSPPEARLEDELWSFAASVQIPEVGVDVRLTSGNPKVRILVEADRLGADLIVLGTPGLSGISRMAVQSRGPLERLLFGSTTQEVVRGATCPVLTIRVSAGDRGWPDSRHPAHQPVAV